MSQSPIFKDSMMPLPNEIRFLEPFITSQQLKTSEEVDEDSNTSILDGLMLKRLRGLRADDAEWEVKAILSALSSWEESSTGNEANIAAFLHAYLQAYQFEEELTAGTEQKSQVFSKPNPYIEMEVPQGWEVDDSSHELELSCGPITGVITVIGESGFDSGIKSSEEQAAGSEEKSTEVSNIRLGENKGTKARTSYPGGALATEVTYFLRVPGGFLRASLYSNPPEPFDETAFEDQLHSLSLVHWQSD